MAELRFHGKAAGNQVMFRRGPTVAVTLCPDTVLCLGAYIPDFLPETMDADPPSTAGQQQSPADLSGSIVLPRAPTKAAQSSPGDQPRRAEIISRVDDDVVQIYDTTQIDLDPGWFGGNTKRSKSLEHQPCTLEVQTRQGSVVLSLFEGYDFDSTRKFVRQAVKATRKRLEKIKQLLAEGQIPEQTLEEAADPLLQSVFLPSRPKLDAAGTSADQPEQDTLARVVAFDDELDQEGEDEEDPLLVWETVNERPAMTKRRNSSTSRDKPQQRISRLRRPRQSAVDVHLVGLRIHTKQFAGDYAIASSVIFKIDEISIIDNIKTSTWNKFLTELRPRDGGITRPSGSPMASIRLKMLRSEDMAVGEGADLSVRVSPLRLHIDQDALDFFKAFFAFRIEPPDAASDVSQAPATKDRRERQPSQAGGGFVQRVEIAAVKIKLDYKPKRVDYYALRQGRAIEMMNFFHFEASEMVLRHLVLTGIPSWAKVGDMLQDIWTPDVKANQLADFLAGINPVRSVVNVGQGVADLVLLPVAQYKKDGRLTRGLQRGGTKFAKSTAMEAIKLGARLATGTQVILEHTEHVLGGRIGHPSTVSTSPAPSSALDSQGRSEWVLTAADESSEMDSEDTTVEPLSRFSEQPEDVKIGLQTAYKSLSGNVRSAAETILAVPMEVYERSSEVSCLFVSLSVSDIWRCTEGCCNTLF